MTNNEGPLKMNREPEANCFDMLTFRWLNPLIETGYKRSLELTDMPIIHDVDRCELQTTLLESYIKRRKNEGKKNYLLWSLYDLRKCEFILCSFLKLLGEYLDFCSPIFLSLLLDYTINPSKYVYNFPWFIVLGMVAAAFCKSMVFAKYTFLAYKTGLIRTIACQGIIYRRSLTISSMTTSEGQTTSTGQITNLISNDAFKIVNGSMFFQNFWYQIVGMITNVCLLYYFLGFSAIIGAVVMIIFVPVQWFLSNKLIALRRSTLKITDSRVNLVLEIIVGIRAVKLLAWEIPFLKKLSVIRLQEIALLRKALYITATNFILLNITPILVAVITFSLYVETAGPLRATVAFTALALFTMLQKPLMIYPRVLAAVLDGLVATGRIQAFLDLPSLNRRTFLPVENKSEVILELENVLFSWSPQNTESLTKVDDLNLKEDANYVKNDDEALKEVEEGLVTKPLEGLTTISPNNKNGSITFSVRCGEMVCIVGPVGSGKSTLLSGILGESFMTQGTLKSAGSLAFVPQNAFILNASVRNNILFGQPFDDKLYNEVIMACALKADLDSLPNGDQTEIGEKGITISGGQKMRVSLARAAYSQADIYLIDDALAAVDAHVAKHIYKNLFCGLLKDRARVIVLHQLEYVSEANQILLFNRNGSLEQIGSFEELMNKEGEFQSLIKNNTSQQENSTDIKEQVEEDEISLQIASSRDDDDAKVDNISKDSLPLVNVAGDIRNEIKLIKAEEKESGTVKSRYWLSYARALTYTVICIVVFCLLSSEGALLGSSFWLSSWVEGSVSTNNGIIGYVIFSACCTILVGIATVAHVLGSISATVKLHDKMMRRIFFAPTRWFDITPTGRILNRVSRDIYSVDELLPQQSLAVLQMFCHIIAVIIAICVVAPYCLILFIPLSFIYKRVSDLYRASSRETKRLDSITKSPVISFFEESLHGVSVIAAFNKTSERIKTSDSLIDANFCWAHAQFALSRWLSLRIEMIGLCVLIFSSSFVAYQSQNGSITSGAAGLLLVYSLQVSTSLQQFLQNSTDCELGMNSIERISDYSENIEQEKEHESSVLGVDLDKTWPQKGNLDVKDLTVAYRQNLDPVLKGISFKVSGGSKIGICGRTGCGKSTLILSLFRIVEASSGSISIDDIDISKIGLRDLRSKIAIVPQDPILFNGTLRKNLDPFGDHTDEEVMESLKIVGLEESINLSGGINADVKDNGNNWSNGEKQLICMARAILKNCKILVMDEASASMDLETDKKLQKMIREIFKDCTVITIAHRLSTIMDYDLILVLDAGKVVEFDCPKNMVNNTDGYLHSLMKEGGETHFQHLVSLAQGEEGRIEKRM